MNTENYFLNCHTEESIAIKYKALAKKYHPDVNTSPEATQIFQEIAKQREQALRAVLKRSGKSDVDINEYIASVFSRDREKSNALVDEMLDEFMLKHDSDKEPTFAEVLKFTMGKFLGGNTKKNVSEGKPGDQKKLK